MKPFDEWNEKKKIIDKQEKLIGLKERDVVFVNMGINIGREQNGKGEEFLRPVVVIKIFNRNLFFGIPLTSKQKNGDFFLDISFTHKNEEINSTAILVQAKSFDTKRVKYKKGIVSKDICEALKNELSKKLTLCFQREPRRELIKESYNNTQDKSIYVHNTAIVDNNVSIGKDTKVWHFSHILSGSKIGQNCSFGQNCVVGPNVTMGNGIKVQNNISIYKGVEIEDDVFLGPSMAFTNIINPRAFIVRRNEFKKKLLKKGCSIGANATIICGVTICEYALIGSGTVVNKYVRPFALIVGVPAKQIGWVGISGNTLKFDKEGKAEDEFTIYKCIDNNEIDCISKVL